MKKRRFFLIIVGLNMIFGASNVCAAIHPNTKIKYIGKTARIFVPNTWETVGSGYVANAPLEELSAVLRAKPDFAQFRVTWNSFPPGYSMSGTALYQRNRGTIEVFARDSGTEATVRSHVLYSGVTDSILHRLASTHATMPKDGYTVSATAFLDELVKYGCKAKRLP